MNNSLQPFIRQVQEEAPFIQEERRQLLESLSELIAQQLEIKGSAELLFICTHNSRRSQFAQVWAQVFAHANGLTDIQCFSGGTEVTAVHPNTVAALERAGIPIEKHGEGENPVYSVNFATEFPPILLSSKVFDDGENPANGFTALMTCAEADEACPHLSNALLRVALTYEDPKESDGTEDEEEAYDEACLIIASEMYYLMSRL